MYSIQETTWEVRETEVYKLQAKGLGALTDTEILAALAGVDIQLARACLTHFNSLQGISRASLAELKQVTGISQQAAISIMCAFCKQKI